MPIPVLLVDDNPNDALLIEEAFRDAGRVCIVQHVSSGDECLAYLRRQKPYEHAASPELILMDVNMPGRDGFQVLRDLKADPRFARLPVVMLTSSVRTEDVDSAYAAGAASFVVKPLTFDQLQRVAQEFAAYWADVAKVPSPAL